MSQVAVYQTKPSEVTALLRDGSDSTDLLMKEWIVSTHPGWVWKMEEEFVPLTLSVTASEAGFDRPEFDYRVTKKLWVQDTTGWVEIPIGYYLLFHGPAPRTPRGRVRPSWTVMSEEDFHHTYVLKRLP